MTPERLLEAERRFVTQHNYRTGTTIVMDLANDTFEKFPSIAEADLRRAQKIIEFLGLSQIAVWKDPATGDSKTGSIVDAVMNIFPSMSKYLEAQ